MNAIHKTGIMNTRSGMCKHSKRVQQSIIFNDLGQVHVDKANKNIKWLCKECNCWYCSCCDKYHDLNKSCVCEHKLNCLSFLDLNKMDMTQMVHD